AGASSGQITVTATPPSGIAASACQSWSAVSNAGFLTITGGASGAGNGTVNYSVAVNSGAARAGTVTVANSNYVVNQVAASLPSFAAAVTVPAAPVTRAEGMTELAGNIQITTSGPAITGGVTGDVVVVYNTTVTNRLLTGTQTDALLLVNDPP